MRLRHGAWLSHANTDSWFTPRVRSASPQDSMPEKCEPNFSFFKARGGRRTFAMSVPFAVGLPRESTMA